MQKKIKEFSKKYLIGFILGLISAGVVMVYATTYFPSNQTTYDNSVSGLKSENVQDAIDELYGVCFPPKAGDQIIEDNGLEKDPYECRYFFTGANPNNYITFNGETAGWRIISVECDGTIKIMRNNSIGDRQWDSQTRTDWNVSSLKVYLNNSYYLNNITTQAQSQIISHDFGIGIAIYNNRDLGNQINSENSEIWNGKIALVTASEYIRTNSQQSICGTYYLLKINYMSCLTTNWMYIDDYWWTLSKYGGDYINRVQGTTGTDGSLAGDDANSDGAVRPALYLSSEVQITGGDGSQSNPYTIE